MGHIVNPVSFRLGKIFFWDFIWSIYTKKNYKYLLIQDISIANFLIWFFNLKKIYKLGFILGFFKILRLHKKIYILLYLYNSKLLNKYTAKKKSLFTKFIKKFKKVKRLTLLFKFKTLKQLTYFKLKPISCLKFFKLIKYKKKILKKIIQLKTHSHKKWFYLPFTIPSKLFKPKTKKLIFNKNKSQLQYQKIKRRKILKINDFINFKNKKVFNVKKSKNKTTLFKYKPSKNKYYFNNNNNRFKNKKKFFIRKNYFFKNKKKNFFNKFFSIKTVIGNFIKKIRKLSYRKIFKNKYSKFYKKNNFIFFIYKIENKILIREVINPKFIKKNLFFFINFGLITSRIKILKKKIIKFLFLYDFFLGRKEYNKMLFLKKFKFQLEYKKMLFLKKCIYFLNYLFHYFIFYYFSKILNNVIKHSLIFKKIKITFIFYNFYKLLNNAKMISTYCSKRLTEELKDRESLASIMYPVLRKLRVIRVVRGFKFLYSGRITRKQRAMYKWERLGIVSLNTKKIPVEFSANIFFTQYGICSLKVWIIRNNSNIKFLKNSMFFSFN